MNRIPCNSFRLAAFLLVVVGGLAPTNHAEASIRSNTPTQSADEAEEDYRYLSGLVERQLWDLAIDAGQKFLRKHPRDERVPLARYRLASAFFAQKKHKEALPHWERLTQQKGFAFTTEAEFRAGECALALGQYKAAEAHFSKVLEGDQEYLCESAGFLLGEAAFQAGEYAQAAVAYGNHLKRYPEANTAPDAQRALVWCARELGDTRQTVLRAREFLQQHASNDAKAEVSILLGEALLETSEPSDALAVLQPYTEDPEHGDAALRTIGFALASLGRPEEAARAFGQVLSDYPNSTYSKECRLQQGVQLISSGQAVDAAEALRPLMRSEDPQVCLWYGRALAGANDLEQAVSAFESGLRLQPDSELQSSLQIARGDALNELGQSQAARAAYAQADTDYALHAAAVSALNAQDPKAAEDFAERLLKRGEQAKYRAQTLVVLGEARFERERWDAAEEAFRLALEAVEDEAARSHSRSRIAWCRYLGGDLETAATLFAALAQEMPEAPEAEESTRMAARSLEEGNHPQEAALAWRSYLDRYGEGEFELEALIALARTTSDPGERKRSLQRAAELDRSGIEGAQALFKLAEDQAQSGDLVGAAVRYQDLLQRGMGEDSLLEARARYGLAWCHFDEERFEQATQLLQPLSQGDRLDTLSKQDSSLAGSVLELLVWSLARSDKPQDAERILLLVCKEKGALLPDDERRFEATRSVAEAWQRGHDPKRAQALFEKLLGSLRSGDVAIQALVEGAYLSLEAQDRDRAEAQLRTALKRAQGDPRVLEACFFLAEARLAAGETRRALAQFAVAAQADSPLAADALYRSGFVQLEAGDNQSAAQMFDTLVQQHPESPLLGETLFLLGESYYRENAYDRAITALERVRQDYPRHEVRPKALFRLGLALGHAERWNETSEVLATLAKEAPQFPNLAEAELWRGRALVALSQPRKARAALERVLKLDDGALAAEARVVKGNLWFEEERFEEALSEFLKVAVLYSYPPAVSEAVFRAGLTLEALQRPEDAAHRYREVLDQHATSTWANPARRALERLEGER